MSLAATSHSAFRLTFAARSMKGKRYEKNEDSLLSLPEWGMFAVADGMGGHAGGAVASSMLVDHLVEASATLEALPTKAWLLRQIEEANSKVYQASIDEPLLKGMGCTLSMLLIDEQARQVMCFQVGDSRVYYLHDFKLVQLTTDHTKGSNDLGAATAEHSGQRGITRAIGVRKTVKVDCTTHEMEPKGEYLLVTDGLSDMLADFEMSNVLTDIDLSYRARVNRLITMANKKGGSDDKSVIFVGLQDRTAA